MNFSKMFARTAVSVLALLALAGCATLPNIVPGIGQSEEPTEVDRYLARIAEIDDAGPELNAVIAVNPNAKVDEAAALARGGPLAGKAILLKDNIESADPLPTTAGSLALKDNITGRDAPLVARLREAGAVILGKANLSEWANIRSTSSSSGWSAIGGQTKNPHAIDRNPCGSSSGSGAAVAASLAWGAVGTETDGSITCPASVNGIVGFKPTVGLVSRTHIVPISSSQDTAGPMTMSVADAALMLSAMAGPDAADPATARASLHAGNFTAGLDAASLTGVRIGVLRSQVGNEAGTIAAFEQALADMETAGAVLVDIDFSPEPKMWEDEFTVLLYELRVELEKYLTGLPGNPPVRSLADVIAFNGSNAATELRWFGQDIFEQGQATTDREAYEAARANSLRLAGPEGIDKLLADNAVTVLVAPTTGPTWPTDLLYGDNYPGGIGAGYLAAIAGYPHLTVPMGAVEGLPVGLSIIGAQWEDREVLAVGAAYERARTVNLPTPTLRRWRSVE